MTRNPRGEYPGATYHVMSRANSKGNIFETDVDRLDFVKSLVETWTKLLNYLIVMPIDMFTFYTLHPWDPFGVERRLTAHTGWFFI